MTRGAASKLAAPPEHTDLQVRANACSQHGLFKSMMCANHQKCAEIPKKTYLLPRNHKALAKGLPIQIPNGRRTFVSQTNKCIITMFRFSAIFSLPPWFTTEKAFENLLRRLRSLAATVKRTAAEDCLLAGQTTTLGLSSIIYPTSATKIRSQCQRIPPKDASLR